MTEHLARPIGDIARSLRAGEVKAEALAEEAIANHDRYDPPLGAYKTWDAGHLLAQARAADAAAAAGRPCGPLHGLPVSVKDLFGVRGFPTFRRLAQAPAGGMGGGGRHGPGAARAIGTGHGQVAHGRVRLRRPRHQPPLGHAAQPVGRGEFAGAGRLLGRGGA